NSKPSVAHMMNCAPIKATRNFHRTPAGNRAVGPSVDVCYERGPRLSVQQKQIVLAEVAASIIAAWQVAVRRRTEAALSGFGAPRRPSQRHNPPPTCPARAQARRHAMTPQESELVDELFNRLVQLETAQRDPEAERLIA